MARHLFDVTASSIDFVAVDSKGRVVRDIRPEELTILEDGEPTRILDFRTRGWDSDDRSATAGTDSGRSEVEKRRVVLYLSCGLGGRGLFKNLRKTVGAELESLAGLGPVDVVLADPEPTVVRSLEHRPDEVRTAFEGAASKASVGFSVDKIRRNFARSVESQVSIANQGGASRTSAAAVVLRAREAMLRERNLVHEALTEMVVWLQTQPPAADGVLVWAAGGFDLDPLAFYHPLVERIDPVAARNLSSGGASFRLDHELEWLIETAVSRGWTVVPVTCTRTGFVSGAEMGGGRSLNRTPGEEAFPFASQGGELAGTNPARVLRLVADATGGHLAADSRSLHHAVAHLGAAYVLAYQVERPNDGRLHEIVIRCSRPGIRICCRHQAASGTLPGVAMGRALRLLSGDVLRGGCPVSARVVNVTRLARGKRVGDLELTAELGELVDSLGPLGLGRMRVTVVVEMARGAPFVHHDELPIDWHLVDREWRYTARIEWPKQARRVAVVAEELVSSSWGATTMALR